MSQTRHCSFCQETNHNIRTCDRYISNIHLEFMNEYVHGTGNYNVFVRTSLENGHIRLLAIKSGFRTFCIRTERLETYLDAFHRHYQHLANAERQRLRDVRNEAFLQRRPRIVRQLPGYILDMRNTLTDPVPVQLYVPNYDQGLAPSTPIRTASNSTSPPPLISRFASSRNLSENIFQFAHEYNISPVSIVRDLMQEIMSLNPIEIPRNNNSVLLEVDASKFPADMTNCECPICYETSEKMAVTKCGHVYCQPCINRWMQSKQNPSCAVCRSSIRDIYLDSEANLNHMMNL